LRDSLFYAKKINYAQMKTKITLKLLAVITCLFLQFNLQAQGGVLPLTLHVEEAGTLSALLGDQVNQVTELTLTGSLNGSDIRTIKVMANLSVLNIGGANIVSGGEPYFTDGGGVNYYTQNNVIGSRMFFNQTKFKAITLPESITSIEANAFQACNGLTAIVVPDKVEEIGDSAFDFCYNLTSVTIGNRVKTIGFMAFFSCMKLASLTIGDTVETIGSYAFQACLALAEIHSGNAIPPVVGTNAFSGIPFSTCRLYVPGGAFRSYAGALGWENFINIIEEGEVAIKPVNKESVSINSISNGIVIETKARVIPVSVYTVSGRKVYQATIEGNTEIRLNQGIYIVKVGEETRKAIVYE
jgi:hypothetical protein